MNRVFVIAAFAGTMLAGTAMAGQQQPAAPAGTDRVITRDEMLAGVDARFARMDANHDGKVTAEERAAAGGPGGGRFGRRMDADGDGAITLEEMRARTAKRFDMMDTNHDGKIDPAERQAAREKMMAMRGHGNAPAAPAPSTPAGSPEAPQGN